MRSVVANLLLLCGAVSVVYGCQLVYQPLAYLAGGAAACACGVLIAKPTDGAKADDC